MAASEEYEPTLHNIIEQDTLKWIFVGGKGGVGKTTTSSSLAIQLAKVRRSVLLISTDPAHNLSDAFSQKFTHEASLVAGYDNLWAMEIDPDPKKNEKLLNFGSLGGGAMSGALQEIAGAFPGIDEAMSFAEVVRLVRSFDFDVVVFDTAPTGHTLRLLSFPTQLEKGLELMMGMKGKLAGMMKAFTSLMDSQSGDSDEDIIAKIKDTKEAIEAVNIQFKNPDLTTFVCVMIPEFLSLYETERMIQELTRFEIDTHNIVINQVVKPAAGDPPCSLCAARQRMQGKYISQAKELYEDFHILELPLLHEEVRGPAALREFGDKYLCPPKST